MLNWDQDQSFCLCKYCVLSIREEWFDGTKERPIFILVVNQVVFTSGVVRRPLSISP